MNIAFETGRVEQRLGKFRKEAPKVMSRALNRAISAGKTQASKDTRSKYTVKAGDINATIDLKKSTKNQLSASFRSRGKRMSLTKYRVTPTMPKPQKPPKSLKVMIEKGNKVAYKGAFLADLGSMKVFKRVTSKRLPIKELTGPSVPQLLKGILKTKTVNDRANEVYKSRLDHEISRILERGKG